MQLIEVFRRRSKEDLSLKSKEELEGECAEILEKDGFGRQDFNGFASRMQRLADDRPKDEFLAPGEVYTGKPRVRNSEERLNYIFLGSDNSGNQSINIRPDLVMENENWRSPPRGIHIEAVGYTTDPPRNEFYGRKMTGFNIQIPPEINNFTSFVDGSSFSVFDDNSHIGVKYTKMTDKEVQAFCGKVFDVYLGSKMQSSQKANH